MLTDRQLNAYKIMWESVTFGSLHSIPRIDVAVAMIRLGKRIREMSTPRQLDLFIREFEPTKYDPTVINNDNVKYKLTLWQKELNSISGTFTLAIGKGLNHQASRAIVEQLRFIADDLDKIERGVL